MLDRAQILVEFSRDSAEHVSSQRFSDLSSKSFKH
jgi:hypothetical protein